MWTLGEEKGPFLCRRWKLDDDSSLSSRSLVRISASLLLVHVAYGFGMIHGSITDVEEAALRDVFDR